MSTETKATELVIPSKESLVAPIVAARAEIQALLDASKGITVAGHTEGKLAGYRAVEELRKKLKGCGTTIEKARKTAKAPFLDLGRFIDGQAAELEEMFRPEEARLKKEADDYLEECRIEKAKKDQAAALRLENRLKEAGERGAAISDIDMKCAREGSDLAWAQHLQQIDKLVERRALIADRKDQLQAAGGDPFLFPEDLADLDEMAFNALLETTIDEGKERERLAQELLDQQETERLAADKDRETRRRFDLLTALGQPVTLEACAALLPEDFEEALADARRKKAEKDAEDDKDRQDLARLRAQQENERKAKEKREKDAETAEAAQKEAERLEALRPERDRLLTWADTIHRALLGEIEITDNVLKADYEHVRDSVEEILIKASNRWEPKRPITAWRLAPLEPLVHATTVEIPEPEDEEVLLEI